MRVSGQRLAGAVLSLCLCLCVLFGRHLLRRSAYNTSPVYPSKRDGASSYYENTLESFSPVNVIQNNTRKKYRRGSGNDAAGVDDVITPSSGDNVTLSSPYFITVEEHLACTGRGETPAARTSLDETPKFKDQKVILSWQFGLDRNERSFGELCPALAHATPCKVVHDLSRGPSADAVVFLADRIPHDPPPFRKRRGQVWVARGSECPHHWFPGYNAPSWRGLFNFTMTYRMDSDFPEPYALLFRLPQAPQSLSAYRRQAAAKTRSVAWFVSDCDTAWGKFGSAREDYVQELRRHIDVDVYGECGQLRCPKQPWDFCRDLLSRKYRFYLAFENSLCKHYVTEKFLDKFAVAHNGRNDSDDATEVRAGIVPVVYGGSDYSRYFPAGTYINAADFPSPLHLARHLHKLGGDLEAYSAMLLRRGHIQRSHCSKFRPWCQLCQRLHQENPTPKVYTDLKDWLAKEACFKPHDILPYMQNKH